MQCETMLVLVHANMVSIIYCQPEQCAGMYRKPTEGKVNQMLYYLMQCLIVAGVALGVYAVVDAIRNYKGK